MTKNSAILRHKNEGKWERKPLKKRWIVPHFYDVTWLIFESLCPTTSCLRYFSPVILIFILMFPRTTRHTVMSEASQLSTSENVSRSLKNLIN